MTRPGEIEVIPLSRRPRDVDRFLRFSYAIYRDDPNWVAPLLVDLKKVFTEANPFFEHAQMQLWMARRGGQDVGRIAAILDRDFIRVQKTSTGFWGFFECVNDPDVARRLFAAASDWCKGKGAARLLGPMNPSSNDECGLLVDGFDSPPRLMMTYNPRYYLDLVANEGFEKAKDLLAFQLDVPKISMDRLGKLAEKVRSRHPEIEFRPLNRRTLAEDLPKIKELYNASWEANWGFTPMTDAEINFAAGRFKPLLYDELSCLAESPQGPLGFILALPDYNQAFKPLRGRLLTPKLLAALPYLLQWKYSTACRVIMLGVKCEWRNRGLEAVMLSRAIKAGLKIGITEAEASWILEDNQPMLKLMLAFGGRVYKTYRLYQRGL
jgi:hypothetical protein